MWRGAHYLHSLLELSALLGCLLLLIIVSYQTLLRLEQTEAFSNRDEMRRDGGGLFFFFYDFVFNHDR